MADRTKIVRDIKAGGDIAIYVGTASILKPIITQNNQNKNPLMKLCRIVTGTVISCGISSIASKWFNKSVDKISEFVDDVKPKPKESENNG